MHRTVMRGSALRTFLVVIALAAGGIHLAKRFLEKPPGLVIRNAQQNAMSRIVVQVSTPDAFGQFSQHHPAVQVGALPSGEKVHVPFGVKGPAKVNVSYLLNDRVHSGASNIDVREGLHLLYEVAQPGRDTFVEGNGVW